MSFTSEDINDIKHAVKYYMQHHVSIHNPRYENYQLILDKLQDINENFLRHS